MDVENEKKFECFCTANFTGRYCEISKEAPVPNALLISTTTVEPPMNFG